MRSPVSTSFTPRNNRGAGTPLAAGGAIVTSSLSPAAWKNLLKPGSSASLLGELEAKLQHNQRDLDLQTACIKDGFGQTHSIGVWFKFFIPVKKIQERGLLIKVRDVVAMGNYLLRLTGMSTDVAVANAILSDNEGGTNTGGNNKHTGSK